MKHKANVVGAVRVRGQLGCRGVGARQIDGQQFFSPAPQVWTTAKFARQRFGQCLVVELEDGEADGGFGCVEVHEIGRDGKLAELAELNVVDDSEKRSSLA